MLRPILIADDNPADIELMTAALRAMNLPNEIVVATDGSEALDYLRAHATPASRVQPPPGVLLLDLKMPRVDGFAVLRALRADPVWRHLPVVVLTSSQQERDIAESYDSGTNAYVVKPVDFQEFLSTVGQLGRFWASLNQPAECAS
ncbi:MAG: response regulator [Opitutae bacterium]|nr:response regulator [Opitutae bacterium]